MSELTSSDTIWVIEIVWADGSRTSKTVDQRDLGDLTWSEWIAEFLQRAQRPHWARLGDLVFYTQNVRSIELDETIDKED